MSCPDCHFAFQCPVGHAPLCVGNLTNITVRNGHLQMQTFEICPAHNAAKTLRDQLHAGPGDSIVIAWQNFQRLQEMFKSAVSEEQQQHWSEHVVNAGLSRAQTEEYLLKEIRLLPLSEFIIVEILEMVVQNVARRVRDMYGAAIEKARKLTVE